MTPSSTPNSPTVRGSGSGEGTGGTGAMPLAVDGATTFSFGLVFDIKGVPVPISAADISRLKEQGLRFELPNPVQLGSFDDLIGWLENKFSVTFPSTEELPTWLKDIIDKITSMTFTVTIFKLNIPKQGATEGMRYALEITGVFPEEPLKLSIEGFDFLTITGGAFGVTNIAPKIDS
jgi:hypothetical protein